VAHETALAKLNRERPQKITDATTGTDNEPMDALRSFGERLRILREENPHASEADLREAVEGAVRVIVTRAREEREQRKPSKWQLRSRYRGIEVPPSRSAQGGPPENPWTPFRQDAAGSGVRG
jgi:hypothetical protein